MVVCAQCRVSTWANPVINSLVIVICCRCSLDKWMRSTLYFGLRAPSPRMIITPGEIPLHYVYWYLSQHLVLLADVAVLLHEFKKPCTLVLFSTMMAAVTMLQPLLNSHNFFLPNSLTSVVTHYLLLLDGCEVYWGKYTSYKQAHWSVADIALYYPLSVDREICSYSWVSTGAKQELG